MKTTDTHVYFWDGIYSNWHICQLKYEENIFTNSEQAFMWAKAAFFRDKEVQEQIILTPDPSLVKKLGRQIKNFNEASWNEVCSGIMVEVNYQKFKQNPFLAAVLIKTDNRILVEASPYDKIWGVGLGEEDPLILDEKNWKGKNLLGKALMEVRRILKNENN